MTDHPELHGVIRLEDQGSEALRQVAAEIHKVAAQAAQAGHAINHMHHEGVLSALREHTEQVGESFGRLHESVLHVHEGITDLLPAFAALGAAGSIAGVFEVVAEQAEKMEALGHTAAIIGITTHQLQRMHYAAQQTGTSTEAMDRGLERLNKNLAAAAHGQDKAVAAALKHAHIKLFDDHGHIRTAIDILPEFSEALKHTGNSAVRAENAMLFMGRAGQELLPVLTLGADKQRELNEEFDHFHPAGADGGRALQEYADSLHRVGLAADGFKESMATVMAPILLPLQNDLAEFLAHQSALAKEHKGIGGVLEAEGHKIKDFLDGVDWDKVGADIDGLSHHVDAVAQAFGGWGRAAEVVAGLMVAKGALWALSPAIALAKVVAGVSKAVWALSDAWRGVEGSATAAAGAEALASAPSLASAAGRNAAQLAATGLAIGEDGLRARAQASQSLGLAGNRAGLRGLSFGVMVALDALEGTNRFELSQDDVYSGLGPKFGGAGGHPWSELSALPQHRGLEAFAADIFGEGITKPFNISEHLPDWTKIFRGDDAPFKAEDFASPIGADGHNPFANPVFQDVSAQPGGFLSDGARPAQPAKLEGDLTLHLDIPGLTVPGTVAHLTTSGLPNGVNVNLGNYDSSH